MKKTIFDYYKDFFNNSFKFKEKTGIKEFWLTMLINFAIGNLIAVFFAMPFVTNFNIFLKVEISVFYLYQVVSFLPAIAIICRRLNDVGKSYWSFLLLLLPLIGEIIFIYYLCLPSRRAISLLPIFAMQENLKQNELNEDGFQQEQSNENDENQFEFDENKSDFDNIKIEDYIVEESNSNITNAEKNNQNIESETIIEDKANSDGNITVNENMNSETAEEIDNTSVDDNFTKKQEENLSRSEQIVALQQLKDEGKISQEEYEKKVYEILNK